MPPKATFADMLRISKQRDFFRRVLITLQVYGIPVKSDFCSRIVTTLSFKSDTAATEPGGIPYIEPTL